MDGVFKGRIPGCDNVCVPFSALRYVKKAKLVGKVVLWVPVCDLVLFTSPVSYRNGRKSQTLFSAWRGHDELLVSYNAQMSKNIGVS